ncbi:topoisomerase C-terminal repeat-containing protein, partial [uncultured Alistipes sp.]|uniref:topoisomerase C-terminal repeat-containing protein n=1 Tax=uncultured Alistipes sp. TaxID=538949 RepID=UPI00272DB0EA
EVKIESAARHDAVCPRCGEAMTFYPKVAKCRNAGCGLTVWRTVARKELTDAQLTDLVTKGRTSVIKGFTKSSGETFEAAVILDKEYKTVFDFAPRNKPNKGRANKRK